MPITSIFIRIILFLGVIELVLLYQYYSVRATLIKQRVLIFITILLGLSIGFYITAIAGESIIYIPDRNNPPPVVSQPSEVVEVNFDNQGITDDILAEMIASGEIPQNVTHLGLGMNQISDITPLQSLKSLTVLFLLDNPIDDITPLLSLTNLTALTIGSTRWLIEISDLTPLQSLINLSELNLFPSQISDITPLASLTNLTSLRIIYNPISDITPLQSLTNLTTLELFDNQINDITPLQSLTSLTELSLFDNQIIDITPLQSLTNLTELRLGGNQISEEQIMELREALPDCEIEW